MAKLIFYSGPYLKTATGGAVFLGNYIVEAGDKDDAVAKEVMEGFADFTDGFANALKFTLF
ncbi:MAG TPA: hypothetical protein ENI55_06530 [Alphaproteobacteria bacterium]|nr:hypothetical protein [Alphaproteobacteria bacterium]